MEMSKIWNFRKQKPPNAETTERKGTVEGKGKGKGNMKNGKEKKGGKGKEKHTSYGPGLRLLSYLAT